MDKEKNTREIIKLLLVAVILSSIVGVCWFCDGWVARYIDGQKDTLSIRVDSVSDTVYVEKHDTIPVERERKVLCYVEIPVPLPSDGVSEDSGTITLPVVQKTYSDDSTYTAYVSGVDYQQWPKLDSITIRQREITNTITKTITIQKKHSRWNVGLQAGYGYGLQYRGFEPYVGIGVGYALFPP